MMTEDYVCGVVEVILAHTRSAAVEGSGISAILWLE